MAEDKRGYPTVKRKAFGQSRFGGISSNDLVTPAWKAVEGGEERAAADLEETPDAILSGGAAAPENSAAYDANEPVDAIDLAAVPDADEIAANSPVDPAAPLTNVFNGIDLLNGAGADDPDDDLRRADTREEQQS